MVRTVADAASDSENQASQVALTIPAGAYLNIIDDSVFKSLGEDGSAEQAFDAGYVEFDAGKPTLFVSSNTGLMLFVKSSGFTGPYPKATADLMLKDAGSQHVNGMFRQYRSLSAQEQRITRHYSEGVKNEEHPCQYKILLDYAKDIPGTYEATVIFTLSTLAI
ncbi:MAG: hypothetical protein KKD11_01055 [Candidatus Omnitrophica bacterium]|nr:hypothetical protein [Candidatus Omnitrophota bacterium]